ncbi:MAG: hypothetical protein WCO55_04845 [Candidatus Falkowbacteria bacterium]
MGQKINNIIVRLNHELQPVLAVGLLVFCLLEMAAPNSVTSVLNLTGWFIAWLISAIIELLARSRQSRV